MMNEMPDTPVVPHARFNFASVYGLVGLVAAIVVHASTFSSLSLSPNNPLFFVLHIGIFPIFIPMVFGLRKWSETSSGAFGMSRYRLRWRELLPYIPWWAVSVSAILFVYAMINFLLATGHLPAGSHVSAGATQALDPERARYTVRAFSGHWMIFYALPTLYFLFVPRTAPPADSTRQAAA